VPDKEGVNFNSQNATSVELLLFDKYDDLEPTGYSIGPEDNKLHHGSHVRGLKPGAHYAYRVDGPQIYTGQDTASTKKQGMIDPYAKGNTNALWDRSGAVGPEDNLVTSMRSLVIDISGYDWHDRPLNRPTR